MSEGAVGVTIFHTKCGENELRLTIEIPSKTTQTFQKEHHDPEKKASLFLGGGAGITGPSTHPFVMSSLVDIGHIGFTPVRG